MSFSNTDTGDAPADQYKKANYEDADLKTKVEEVTNLVKGCQFGMMTTQNATSGELVSRCMALADTENNDIDLLFHTNTESGKTNDLNAESKINISFTNPSGEWASYSGRASIVTDRSLVKEHYNPMLRTWMGDLGDGTHDGSENDPRIGIIRVQSKSITYSIVRKNVVSRTVEMVQGAVTGKAAKVNFLREISESEVNQWRAVTA